MVFRACLLADFDKLCLIVQECDATTAQCLFDSRVPKNKKALLWKQDGL